MAKVVKGPATQSIVTCPCGARTAVQAGTVGNIRCSGCGNVQRVRK